MDQQSLLINSQRFIFPESNHSTVVSISEDISFDMNIFIIRAHFLMENGAPL